MATWREGGTEREGGREGGMEGGKERGRDRGSKVVRWLGREGGRE